MRRNNDNKAWRNLLPEVQVGGFWSEPIDRQTFWEIIARVGGYLDEWVVDVVAPVKWLLLVDVFPVRVSTDQVMIASIFEF